MLAVLVVALGLAGGFFVLSADRLALLLPGACLSVAEFLLLRFSSLAGVGFPPPVAGGAPAAVPASGRAGKEKSFDLVRSKLHSFRKPLISR